MSLKKIYESLAAAKPFITEQTMYLVWSKKTDNSVDGGPYWDLKSAANNMWSPDQFVMNMDTYEPVVSYEEYQSQVDESGINENAESLNVGDDVIITGPVQFHGKTGIIDSFGSGNRFVVVNLYNHGKHSFHSSDVSFNEYADSDEEESDRFGEEESWDDDIDEGRDEDRGDYEHNIRKQRELDNPRPKSSAPMDPPEEYEADPRMAGALAAQDHLYGRKKVKEGDPDIPLDVHKAMKAKEREQFSRNMARTLASANAAKARLPAGQPPRPPQPVRESAQPANPMLAEIKRLAGLK